MPYEARGDLAPTPSRRSGPGDQHRVHYLFPKEFVPIVKALYTHGGVYVRLRVHSFWVYVRFPSNTNQSAFWG